MRGEGGSVRAVIKLPQVVATVGLCASVHLLLPWQSMFELNMLWSTGACVCSVR